LISQLALFFFLLFFVQQTAFPVAYK